MLSKEEVKYKRKLDFDHTSYDFTARSGAVKVILIDIDRGKNMTLKTIRYNTAELACPCCAMPSQF